jgi:phosphomevalonate kinase
VRIDSSSNGRSLAKLGRAWTRSAKAAVRGQRSGSTRKRTNAALRSGCGDGDVGEGELVEDEAVGGQLGLEVVEDVGDVVLVGAAEQLGVGLLAPHEPLDDVLVEQAPDEHLAHAGVGELLEPAGARAGGGAAGEQRRRGVALVEVLADDGRVGEDDLVVEEDGDAADRAELGELVVGEEGDDRVDLVGDVLDVEDDQDLADVGRDVRAEDPHRRLHARGHSTGVTPASEHVRRDADRLGYAGRMRRVVALSGKRFAGKDTLAAEVIEMAAARGVVIDSYAFAAESKRMFAARQAARGVEVSLAGLLGDRAYKELWRPRLTAFTVQALREDPLVFCRAVADRIAAARGLALVTDLRLRSEVIHLRSRFELRVVRVTRPDALRETSGWRYTARGRRSFDRDGARRPGAVGRGVFE